MALFFFLFLSTFPSWIFSLNITNFTKIPLPPNVTSPNSIAFDLFGNLYTGASDGRVFTYNQLLNSLVEFSHTSPNRTRKFCDGINDQLDRSPICGLPLGLGFDYLRGSLYACDPFVGLTAVGLFGGLATTLVPTIDGVTYRFLLALDVAINGVVYFTDASAIYGPKDAEISIQTGDSTARLLKYDPATKQVTVLLTQLSGAVGVATDKDATFVLVSEFIAKRVRKYWLKGEKAGTSEILLTFTGDPNKIKRNQDGDFWVTDNILMPDNTTVPLGVKFDSNGNVLATVDFSKEYNRRITVTAELDTKLYTGGRTYPFVGRYDLVY